MDRRDGDRRRRRMGGFLPTQIANLAVWLRADLGITKDGSDAISQWDFENGTFRGVTNVNQGLGANQPTHVVSNANFNGHSTVSFDGGDFLDGDNWSSALGQPVTYFIVANIDADGSETFIDRAGGVDRNQIGARLATTDWTMFSGLVLDSVVNTDTSIHIFETIFNGASSEMILDGTTIISGDAGAQDLDSIRVGDNIILTGGLNGDIAEIIIYDALTPEADRISVRNYLSGRYDITV